MRIGALEGESCSTVAGWVRLEGMVRLRGGELSSDEDDDVGESICGMLGTGDDEGSGDDNGEEDGNSMDDPPPLLRV